MNKKKYIAAIVRDLCKAGGQLGVTLPDSTLPRDAWIKQTCKLLIDQSYKLKDTRRSRVIRLFAGIIADMAEAHILDNTEKARSCSDLAACIRAYVTQLSFWLRKKERVRKAANVES